MNNQRPQTNNVFQFSADISPKRLYDAQTSINQAKQTKEDFCDEVLDFVMEHTFSSMKSFGFFADSSRINHKDIVLLEQAIGAILYRYYNLDHEFHPITEDLISIPGEEDLDDEPAAIGDLFDNC